MEAVMLTQFFNLDQCIIVSGYNIAEGWDTVNLTICLYKLIQIPE